MLAELPCEVLCLVVSYLHADSICLLRGVCRRLRDVLDDDRLFSSLASFYCRHGIAPLLAVLDEDDISTLSCLLGPARSRADFVSRLREVRLACAPVFCFFLSASELCFGNCLSGEMLVVPSHLAPSAHPSLDWVENGKKKEASSSVTSNAISLLFALAKEHRRFGICCVVESACFQRDSFGAKDILFPNFTFEFESLPLLIGSLFDDECVILILEDDRMSGWGVTEGKVGVRVTCSDNATVAKNCGGGATDLRRHVNGLRKNVPAQQSQTIAAEQLLIDFARQHRKKRIVLIGGEAERFQKSISLWRHEPQIFHCVFRAIAQKAASINYGRMRQ